MKPTVLDVCCGSRGFWFDRQDQRTVFCDNRTGSYPVGDRAKPIIVRPDLRCDFTALPFSSSCFNIVVFDPPHLKRNGMLGDITKRYGILVEDWRGVFRKAFLECFRVLRSTGSLVLKWNSVEIPLSQVLELTEQKPLIGHRTGKKAQTHWVLFNGVHKR